MDGVVYSTSHTFRVQDTIEFISDNAICMSCVDFGIEYCSKGASGYWWFLRDADDRNNPLALYCD